MIIAAAHHRINRRRLFFTCIRVIRIIARDDEIVHFFLEHLLTSSILNVTSCGAGTIFATHIILFILDAVLHTKVCVSIELLTTWTVFIPCTIEYLALLWHDTHWINHHCEVFFEVCRTQYFQLQIWNITLFY